jgi:thymidylate kinase
MDLGLSRDWFGSFIRYQRRMRKEFHRLRQTYNFEAVNANRGITPIQEELKDRVRRVLQSIYPKHEIS